MCWVSIDIETDGLIPSKYSMISFGAVIIEKDLKRTFYATLKPISEKFSMEALAISGFSREKTLEFEDPIIVMLRFKKWLDDNCKSKPYFISDNNGFDRQFINWYLHCEPSKKNTYPAEKNYIIKTDKARDITDIAFGVKYHDLPAINKDVYESETLIPPGINFKVDGIDEDGRTILKEIE